MHNYLTNSILLKMKLSCNIFKMAPNLSVYSKGAIFTPQPLRAVGVLFSPMVSGWAGGRREIVCPGCFSETVRCRKFILGRDIGWGCRCATSWSDLDLTFDLAVVSLTYKTLSRAIPQQL